MDVSRPLLGRPLLQHDIMEQVNGMRRTVLESLYNFVVEKQNRTIFSHSQYSYHARLSVSIYSFAILYAGKVNRMGQELILIISIK